MALEACGGRPHVILAFDDIYQEQLDDSDFPTIIRVRSLDTPDVEAVAKILMPSTTFGTSAYQPAFRSLRKPWARFFGETGLKNTTLYVIQNQKLREILGFCATYYVFAAGGEHLVGCLGIIVVGPSSRNLGYRA